MIRAPSLGLLLALLGGCVSPTMPPMDGMDGMEAPETAIELKNRFEALYVLGVADEVEIVVHRVPEASQRAVIRPDGYVSLPLIDEVKAAGLTLPDLDAVLTERYRERLVNPEVSVLATSVREPLVYVLGQVARPGPIPFRNASTGAEALAQAGDALPSAALTSAAVIRLGSDGLFRVTKVDAARAGQPGPYLSLAAMQLEPQDLLFIPENDIYQLSRLIDQIVKPFSGFSTLLNPYLQFKTIQVLENQ